MEITDACLKPAETLMMVFYWMLCSLKFDDDKLHFGLCGYSGFDDINLFPGYLNSRSKTQKG